MDKSPTIKEILALNPHINEQRLEEAREALRKLRSNRIKARSHRSVPPFLRRPIVAGATDKVDSRTVILRRTVP